MKLTRDNLTVGDEVKITLTGTVESLRDDNACTRINDGVWNHWVYVGSNAVVTKITSQKFEPKPGEIYRVGEAGIWLCAEDGPLFGSPAGEMLMISMANVSMSPEHFAKSYLGSYKKVYPV
jgi:hypothetical protein